MSILSAVDLSKSFGVNDIFSGINLEIPHSARIAIVGPNGIGKTTLLRILLGLDEASGGEVVTAKKLKTGYLPQEAGIEATHSLWEQCLMAVSELRRQEAQLAQMESEMAKEGSSEALLDRYGKLQEAFEREGGYTYETRIKRILSGLGFEERDFNRPLDQLSGGQRTRALLAYLLLSNPDLLVLDEPTNHLDISAVEWLEGYLNKWDGAVVLVSHDRYFLDRVAETIWEMNASGLELYRGNYSAYLLQRQERWEKRSQIFSSEKARFEKELDYIKRNIASQRTQHAKGKLKRLSREVQAVESLGFETVIDKNWSQISQQADISEHTMSIPEVESRIRRLKPPSARPPRLNLYLKTAHRSGELVIRTRDLVIGYEDEGKPLFRAPDLLLKLGECAAVIGPNGAGKTTFLKTLLDQVPPLEGEVILGSSLRIGYFAQAHEDLDPHKTLVQEVEAQKPNMLVADIRNYLGRFLFHGEDVFRKVESLSGGERGRLALAVLALTDANLLMLDEPTNHLDIPSQEILQEVLSEYQGTMLLVSHDRYLIDALGTQIWEIQPDQTELHVFQGTYSQYQAYLVEKKEQESEDGPKQGEPRQIERRRTASKSNQERNHRIMLEKIESKIANLEKELAAISRVLEDPPEDRTVVQELGEDYLQIQNQMDELLVEWEILNLNI